jgi:hypothetical protein
VFLADPRPALLGGCGVTAAPVFFADGDLPLRGVEMHATASSYLDLKDRIIERKTIKINDS